jgi:hypothetical protein
MVSAPPHKLTPALAGSCGPTAVCAVTGKTPKQVHSAIIEAASEDDEKPAHLDNCSFRHQARATEILDCELFELDGSRVQARSIPSPVDAYVATQLPTVRDFFQQNQSKDVLLCLAFGVRPGQHTTEDTTEVHTFAVDRGWYFDNNTSGEVVTSPPSALADFRVVRVLVVRQ